MEVCSPNLCCHGEGVLHILSVCLYSCLSYPACNLHLFGAILYCRLYHNFYVISSMARLLEKKLLYVKCVFHFTLQICLKHFPVKQCHKCMCVSM